MAGRVGLCSLGQPVERVRLSECPLPPPFPGQVGVHGKGPCLCWQSVGAPSEQRTGPGRAEPALPSCCLSVARWGLSPELLAISRGGGGGQLFRRSTGTSLHLQCHTPHTLKDQSSNQKSLSLRPGRPARPPPSTGAPSLGLDGACTGG